MNSSSQSRPAVLWAQVCGLALLQGAIALAWVIYNLYVPVLLEKFGFPRQFSTTLLMVENGLAILMEPLMGSLSDRAQHWLGTRFPLIAAGVVLSSGLFITIPAIAIFNIPVGSLAWILPTVLVAWALAMTLFRSPALSLLGRYAFATHLPQAASILTLMGALAGAIGGFANQWLLSLGPMITFAAGSFVLLAATTALRWVNPQRQTGAEENPLSRAPISFRKLGLVFGAGAGITLGFILMRSLLAPVPGPKLVAFTLAHLLTIVPAGLLAVRLGNIRAMLSGLGLLTGTMVILAIAHTSSLAIGLSVFLGIAFSLVANGTIPFALSLVPAAKAGLGTGMYFGGASLAGSLFGAIVSQVGALPAAIAATVGAIAFLLAGLCIAASTRSQ